MQWYGQALAKALNKEIDFDTDVLVVTLHTATYVPNRATHVYVSDLAAELATGLGYTVGGAVMTGKTIVTTAANSWGTSRANSTTYALGDVVRPAAGNGFLYRATNAGTSGATIPVYPTVVGQTVVDGGITWENVGTVITVLDFNDPLWAAPVSFTGMRYAVLSDRTPGTAATQPLLGYTDFTTDQSGAGGEFKIVLSAQGALHIFTP